jgi:hypothetical protein
VIDRRGKPIPPAVVWRRRVRLIVGLLVLGMAVLATLIDTPLPFSTSDDGSAVAAGLFVGSQAPSDVLALGQQLGVTPTIDTVYADGSCYCTYSPPSTSMTLMLAVGALTTSEATSIGQSLVAAGQSDAIVRIMWEQNQDVEGWFQDWNQLTFTAAQYISTFQSIVTTMRAVPGQAFRFMWNPSGGTGNEAAGRTWSDTWPGKSYVDLVGVDQYDFSGYSANIQAVIAFAQSQGLPAAIPEWGLNGSDDPAYINGVADLVNNAANDVALQAYFSYDGGSGGIDSDITQFPESEAAYSADFAGSAIPLPSPTTTTPAPTTTSTSKPPPTPTTTSTTEPPSTPTPTTTTTTLPPTTPTTSPPTTTPTTSIPESTSTTVTVVPEVGSSAQGLTATVSPTPDGGTVQFIVDGWAVGNAVPVSADGSAVLAVYLADGPHLVDASYSGDSAFDSSAVDTVVGVGQVPTLLLAATPARIGPPQTYQLSATLSSLGAPLSGASVWFSGGGSALCVSTTNATGVATCTIDEGTTDVFSLATSGDVAAFGGDPTHLPASDQSPAPGEDHSTANIGTAGTNENDGQDITPPARPPASPASAAASDTPATLDVAHGTSITRAGSRNVNDMVFMLLGLLGLALVGTATLGRRRLARTAIRDDRP